MRLMFENTKALFKPPDTLLNIFTCCASSLFPSTFNRYFLLSQIFFSSFSSLFLVFLWIYFTLLTFKFEFGSNRFRDSHFSLFLRLIIVEVFRDLIEVNSILARIVIISTLFVRRFRDCNAFA